MSTIWKLIDNAATGIAYGLGGALGLWLAEQMVGINIVLTIAP